MKYFARVAAVVALFGGLADIAAGRQVVNPESQLKRLRPEDPLQNSEYCGFRSSSCDASMTPAQYKEQLSRFLPPLAIGLTLDESMKTCDGLIIKGFDLDCKFVVDGVLEFRGLPAIFCTFNDPELREVQSDEVMEVEHEHRGLRDQHVALPEKVELGKGVVVYARNLAEDGRKPYRRYTLGEANTGCVTMLHCAGELYSFTILAPEALSLDASKSFGMLVQRKRVIPRYNFTLRWPDKAKPAIANSHLFWVRTRLQVKGEASISVIDREMQKIEGMHIETTSDGATTPGLPVETAVHNEVNTASALLDIIKRPHIVYVQEFENAMKKFDNKGNEVPQDEEKP